MQQSVIRQLRARTARWSCIRCCPDRLSPGRKDGVPSRLRIQSCSARLARAFEIVPRRIAKSTCSVEKARPNLFVSACNSLAILVSVQPFGSSSKTRNTREDRPENTLVLGTEFEGVLHSLLCMPSRWSVKVPGTLIETLPARSRKLTSFSMQNACERGGRDWADESKGNTLPEGLQPTEGFDVQFGCERPGGHEQGSDSVAPPGPPSRIGLFWLAQE